LLVSLLKRMIGGLSGHTVAEGRLQATD